MKTDLVQQYETLTFDNWKVRASATNKILSASGKIIQGIETFLKEEYNRIARGYFEEFTSKYTDKGNWREEDTMSVLQQTILKGHFPVQNKERLTNDFVMGKCDVHLSKRNLIVDNKNSYNWKTFDDASLTKDYEMQLRSYMWLWNCDEAILFYCLQNLPEQMLQDEERKMFYGQKKWTSFEDTGFEIACNELRERLNFEKFPIEDRFKCFKISRDLTIETQIAEMVGKCRIWLNDYHQQRMNLRKQNQILITK